MDTLRPRSPSCPPPRPPQVSPLPSSSLVTFALLLCSAPGVHGGTGVGMSVIPEIECVPVLHLTSIGDR